MPDYEQIARSIAIKHGIDPNIFASQIRQESGFDPNARSYAGALGIAQIVPRWHPGVDPLKPVEALNYAAQHDAELLKKYGGDWRQVLSVYNSGRPDKWSDPNFSGGQTYNYVRKILGGGYVPGKGSAVPSAASGAAALSPALPAALPQSQPPLPQPSMAQPNIAGALLGSLGQGPGDLLNALLGAHVEAATQPPPLPTNAPLPSPAPLPTAPAPPSPGVSVPLTTTPGKGGFRAGVAEAFYDPLGSYDQGRFGGPIGRHSNHVHISASDPQTMLRAIKLAQSMGLSVRENPYTENVDPVHTEGSYHYRTFPGLFGGKKLGQGIDVSGSPDKMASFYRAMTAS